jgi:hypothetical protein
MWVLRVYNLDDDELVAEHDLDVDESALERIVGFAPTKFGSTPLDREALTRLDQALASLRRPGRESWQDRECFLDFDAEPSEADLAGHTRRPASRLSRRS